MINRRTLVGAAAAGFFARLHAAPVGAAKGRPKIGRLSEGGPSWTTGAFRDAMRDLGHPDVAIEERYAHGQFARLPALADELLRLQVDVLWVNGTVATQAAKDATTAVPIVMVSADAVRAGLVASLGRPGGNLTGLTLIGTELVGKRLELMTQLHPRVKRVIGVGHGPDSIKIPVVADLLRENEMAASKLRLPFSYVELSTDPKQWDDAMASLVPVPGTALVIGESPFFLHHRVLLAELALKHRLPSVFPLSDHVRAGGLCSYGQDVRYIVTRSASYVSRILKGAKPGNLPVERPTKYELLINAKTAKALGLTIPRSVLVRADEVIE